MSNCCPSNAFGLLELNLKTPIGKIDLDPELVALFKDFHAKRTGDFVIESHAQPNLEATYANTDAMRSLSG
jgi:hypothetical protein